MDTGAELPKELRELDLRALVGLTVEEAGKVVSDAGGEYRTTEPGGAVSADFRGHRVTLTVVNGSVVEADGFY